MTHLTPAFPVFWDSARGTNVRDVDGNVFLDLTGAFGVSVAGHGNPLITQEIRDQAERLVHGKTSPIYHGGEGIFTGLPSPFVATRYHSLIVDPQLPDDLEATAFTEEGEVMGLQHKSLPIFGVQFHPESILTAGGKQLLKNFLLTETR